MIKLFDCKQSVRRKHDNINVYINVKKKSYLICLNVRNYVREIESYNYYRKQYYDINCYIFVNHRIIVSRAQIDVD